MFLIECVNLCPQVFAFNYIYFRGMLHHVCDVPMTKACVDQSELVDIGAQID